MSEFITKDFHNDFVKHCHNQVEILNRKIHEYDIQIYNIYYYLCDNYHLLVEYKINPDLDYLFSFKSNNNKHIKIIDEMSITDKYFISRYNEMLSLIDVVNKLSILLLRYAFMQRIPYLIYKALIYAINIEITISLLKGHSFTFPKIGSVFIIRVPYNNSIPDWNNSKNFKTYLEDSGIQTKDKTNENGKAWLVGNGLDRDDFVLLRWAKYTSQLRNKEPYRMFPSSFDNLYNKEGLSINEVIHSTTTGLFDKIVYLYKHYPDYTTSNFPFLFNPNNSDL